MATRSVHILTTATGGTTQQSSVVHAATGTIITNGAVQVLYDDAAFREKDQVVAALQLIIHDIQESPADSAFTGTI